MSTGPISLLNAKYLNSRSVFRIILLASAL